MPTRKAEAVWQGTLREGSGTVKLGSGRYEGPYTYVSRFESGEGGTNPEELIGAAHAGCFSMFLSSLLTKSGYTPTRIHTTASVHLGQGKIDKIELDCEADVPNLSQDELQNFADQAKSECPVSKALGSVDEIVLNATLVGA